MSTETLPKPIRSKKPMPATMTGSYVGGMALVVAVFLGVWELFAVLGWINVTLLSQPSAIAAALPDLLTDPSILEDLTSTGGQVLTAFVIACTTGLLAGTVLALSPIIREAFLPVVDFMLATPKPMFVPLFVLYFGLDPKAAIAYASFEGFFYVVVNVVAGVDLVRPMHRRVAKAFGASRRHLLTEVIVPGAIPGITTAMWNGARHAMSGVITVQIFSAAVGVGVSIKGFANSFQSDSAMALIVLLSLLALLINVISNRVDTRLAHWRPATA